MLCEVVFASSPELQTLVSVEIIGNVTVVDVIQQSGILLQFPEIDLQKNVIGIFGKKVDPYKTFAQEGDRIEIYRPLFMDPKQARLLRVRRPTKQSAMRKVKSN